MDNMDAVAVIYEVPPMAAIMDKVASVLEWMRRHLNKLRHETGRSYEVNIMLPPYMEEALRRYQMATFGVHNLDSLFYYRGVKIRFDSPTHNAYLYHKDWCYYPEQQLRYSIPIFEDNFR